MSWWVYDESNRSEQPCGLLLLASTVDMDVLGVPMQSLPAHPQLAAVEIRYRA